MLFKLQIENCALVLEGGGMRGAFTLMIKVFRPKNLGIDRFSRDSEELEELYDSAYQLAAAKSAQLKDWLLNIKE